jgi:hypothetical protein
MVISYSYPMKFTQWRYSVTLISDPILTASCLCVSVTKGEIFEAPLRIQIAISWKASYIMHYVEIC